MPQTTDFLTLTSRTSAKKTQLAVPAVTRIVQSSTVTSKGQTTIPKAVRDALGLVTGDQILFQIGQNGVELKKQEADEDPAIAAFLDFLAADMLANPESLQPLSDELCKRSAELTHGMIVDLDEDIVGEVAL